MKIYTKTGDKGTTSLFGGTRVSKADIRLEAYGTVDELNSYLGLIRDTANLDNISKEIIQIQQDLFVLGAHLATEKKQKANGKQRLPSLIEERHIEFIEKLIDFYESQLPPLTKFILPGGHFSSSHCQVARTVCRRAERVCVRLLEIDSVYTLEIKYLNRLSDLLFVYARIVGKANKGYSEYEWLP